MKKISRRSFLAVCGAMAATAALTACFRFYRRHHCFRLHCRLRCRFCCIR